MGKTATKIYNNFISMTVKRRNIGRSITNNKSDDDDYDGDYDNNNNKNQPFSSGLKWRINFSG
jgi:hypothetical protein